MSGRRARRALALVVTLSLGEGCGSCGRDPAGERAPGATGSATSESIWGPSLALPHGGWVRVLAGAGSVRPVRVAADPAGGVVVVGSFAGSFDLGAGAVTAQPGAVAGRTDDAFVARFDGAGTPIFARAFGDSSAQSGDAVTVDRLGGSLAMGGAFGGRLLLGPGAPAVARGPSDGFVALLGPRGEPKSLRAVAGPGVEAVRGLAVDGHGDLVVGGTYTGAGPFAGGGACPDGALCAFAARLGADGALRDAVVVRGSGTTAQVVPVAGPADAIVFAGTVRGRARIEAVAGPAGLDLPCGADGGRAFVASADGAGAPRWARCFGDGEASEVSVAVGLDGTVYVAAAEQARGGRDAMAARDDVRVAAFTATGEPRWSKLFGDADRQTPHAIAAGPRGPIVAGGMFGTLDFGGGVLTSDDGVDAFVAELAASDGAHVTSHRLGSGGSQEAFGIACLPDGAVAVAGLFDGTLRTQTGAVDAKSRFDVFVVTLER